MRRKVRPDDLLTARWLGTGRRTGHRSTGTGALPTQRGPRVHEMLVVVLQEVGQCLSGAIGQKLAPAACGRLLSPGRRSARYMLAWGVGTGAADTGARTGSAHSCSGSGRCDYCLGMGVAARGASPEVARDRPHQPCVSSRRKPHRQGWRRVNSV